MSLHIHRNSFNAGEISPLMGARVDVEKTRSGCRVMENFLPRVYGGAFRRPGTLHVARQHDLAEWTENDLPHRILFADADAPTVNDDSFYEVGSLWLRIVSTIYRAVSTSENNAVWTAQSGTHNLHAYWPPNENNDSSEGYAVGSVWLDRGTGAFYTCAGDTPGSAAWVLNGLKCNPDGESAPTSADNLSEGYQANSYWVLNVLSLYECADNASGAAVWNLVGGANNLSASRAPTGADTGHAIGEFWIWQTEDRAWGLTALDNQEPVRLVDFNVSATDRYMFLLGDGYLRIFNADGSPFLDRLNSPYDQPLQLSTPYRSSEIFDVQIAQLGNLAYFAHPNHPPQKIERYFDASFASAAFKWSEVDWSFPCFRDPNQGPITATPSGTSGNLVTISFSGNPFIETMDFSRYTGARIALTQRRPASHVKATLTNATVTSDPISVLGEYELYTYGTFTGTLSVQSKGADGAWTSLRSFEATAESARQIVFRSATEKATDLRIQFIGDGTTSGTAYLEAADSRRTGYARILNGVEFFNGLARVQCEVELPFDSTDPTTEWAIESWAPYSGYPRAVAFHEQRLWFGGTELQPNTIWASGINDFENFRRGAFDADSIAFTLAASKSSAIQSFLSHQALAIFTQFEEWTASTSEQTAITPSNIFVRRQSLYGSAHRQAFVANNNLLFIQRGGRKLREFVYGGGGGQGRASDLTTLSEHVTRGGLAQTAFQHHPDPTVWCVTGAGELVSMVFEVDQDVIAWARHKTQGVFESVAVLYGDDDGGDSVWVSVIREIDGESARFIERLDEDFLAKLDSEDYKRLVHCDAAVVREFDPPSATVSDLDHLEGEAVDVLADGSAASATVEGGEITLAEPASTVVVGLPFASILQPSKIELELQTGTAQSRKWLCKRAALNLWKTGAIEYADSHDAPADQWFPVPLGSDPNLDEVADPFTGMVEAVNLGSHRGSVDVTLRASGPLPANILAIIPKIEVSGS